MISFLGWTLGSPEVRSNNSNGATHANCSREAADAFKTSAATNDTADQYTEPLVPIFNNPAANPTNNVAFHQAIATACAPFAAEVQALKDGSIRLQDEVTSLKYANANAHGTIALQKEHIGRMDADHTATKRQHEDTMAVVESTYGTEIERVEAKLREKEKELQMAFDKIERLQKFKDLFAEINEKGVQLETGEPSHKRQRTGEIDVVTCE